MSEDRLAYIETPNEWVVGVDHLNVYINHKGAQIVIPLERLAPSTEETMTVDEIRDQVANHGWTISVISGMDPEMGEITWHVTIKAGDDDWCTGIGFDAGSAAQRAIQGLLESFSLGGTNVIELGSGE